MTDNNKAASQPSKSDANEKQPNSSFVMRNWPIFLILSIISFYLVTEHTAHLLGALPWLILLACPFIHIFMHRGHEHGGHNHANHNHNDVKNEQP